MSWCFGAQTALCVESIDTALGGIKEISGSFCSHEVIPFLISPLIAATANGRASLTWDQCQTVFFYLGYFHPQRLDANCFVDLTQKRYTLWRCWLVLRLVLDTDDTCW